MPVGITSFLTPSAKKLQRERTRRSSDGKTLAFKACSAPHLVSDHSSVIFSFCFFCALTRAKSSNARPQCVQVMADPDEQPSTSGRTAVSDSPVPLIMLVIGVYDIFCLSKLSLSWLNCLEAPAHIALGLIAIAASVGMAGSGKTTLMQRFNNYFALERVPSYIVNLDPAVTEVPYEPNIDIRDTVWPAMTALPRFYVS